MENKWAGKVYPFNQFSVATVAEAAAVEAGHKNDYIDRNGTRTINGERAAAAWNSEGRREHQGERGLDETCCPHRH